MDRKRLIPYDGGALTVLRELGEIVKKRPDVAKRFRELAEVGPPLFVGKIDRSAACLAGEYVVVYEPSDRLHAFMAAIRAGYGKPDNPLKLTADSHDKSSLVGTSGQQPD